MRGLVERPQILDRWIDMADEQMESIDKGIDLQVQRLSKRSIE